MQVNNGLAAIIDNSVYRGDKSLRTTLVTCLRYWEGAAKCDNKDLAKERFTNNPPELQKKMIAHDVKKFKRFLKTFKVDLPRKKKKKLISDVDKDIDILLDYFLE